MNSLIKSLRIGFLITSFFFLLLGIAAIPRLAAENELGDWVVVFGTGLLLPAILSVLAYSRVPSVSPTRTSSENGGASYTVSFAVLSLIPSLTLWLLWLLLALTDSSHLVKEALIPGGVDVVLLLMLFVFIRALTRSSTGLCLSGRSSQSRAVLMCHWLDSRLESSERILRPILPQTIGAALALGAPLIASSDSLLQVEWLREKWVTAEYGLGDRLPALQSTFNFLGHASFVVASLLAASTLLYAIARFTKFGTGVPNRLCKIFTIVAAILGAYSAFDLYFGWMGFFGGEHASSVWLWSFFALGAFVLTCGLAMVAASVLSHGAQRAILIPCIFMLYTTIACANVLFTTAFVSIGDRGFNGLASFYVGVQFLAWGWIGTAIRSEVSHEKNKFEACPVDGGSVMREATITH